MFCVSMQRLAHFVVLICLHLVYLDTIKAVKSNGRGDDVLNKLIKIKERLTRFNEYDDFYTNHLNELLLPRVPGTQTHDTAKQFIISKLKEYGWFVELDEFIDKTPVGNKPFTNIVAIFNRSATKYLSLVAHYDTKDIPAKNGKPFIGATDSAVSCAMLLQFARLFNESLAGDNKIKIDVSPMLIFTDGEESFVSWSDTDSLYGSRHLAAKMATQPHHNSVLANQGVNILESLEAFVLLDLIGEGRGWFLDMYPSASSLYWKMKDIELKLKRKKKIKRSYSYFYGKHDYDEVEDDHIPFLKRGVSTLHLIVIPFPKVWHKITDDLSSLNQDSIIDLLRIFQRFLVEYFYN